jgi:hypothetical protein
LNTKKDHEVWHWKSRKQVIEISTLPSDNCISSNNTDISNIKPKKTKSLHIFKKKFGRSNLKKNVIKLALECTM